MKCPRCNGQGFSVIAKWKCPVCDGKGEVEQTNEEWLRSASTEDVAKWLSKISKYFHECGKRDVYPKTMYEEDWERWLKEKHKE